jgi:hypothetical protein
MKTIGNIACGFRMPNRECESSRFQLALCWADAEYAVPYLKAICEHGHEQIILYAGSATLSNQPITRA